MAAFPICYKTPYKDQNLPTQSVIRQNEKRFMYDCDNMIRSFSTIPGQICRSCHPLNKVNNNILTKSCTKDRNVPRSLVHDKGSLVKNVTKVCSSDTHLSFIQGRCSKRENLSTVWCSAESSSAEKQLKSLDSYFGKLQHNPKLHRFDSSHKVIQVNHSADQSKSKSGLESLDEYLGKLNNGINQESRVPSYVENRSEENLAPKQSLSKNIGRVHFRKQNAYVDMRRIKGVGGPRFAVDSQQHNETSSLYLIGILASVNIAVFLFEIASPIRSADLELFSIPLLYGAKINHLILVGEWWRLITPMFLHAGILHMALSCWALLTFGPQVCRGYGSFTFFLIYILGGVSGNLTSFLHTPDPTVGGTEPVFAIIGAWLMYQILNKGVISTDASENLFQKAIIITALVFILSHFGPIDEWSHFGAAFSGMAYGFLTSPTLQLNDTSSGSGQEEGLKLVRKNGDSCKSLMIFTIFIIVLSSILFFMEPPPNALASVNAAAADTLEFMLIFG
ncbi:RHOMBOID-like protein 9, chloroplastic isoform X1 [Abrus precatorius]|nr:RHOMBOID-like protein 9, chloroplastic isoform X1 [Abrus precatorius]XP_027357706.1 RHOMBOID-like protein 9, chloroplastic isoform X1 [Abrus precatorius]XP_027357708.1 RHOMBOID-like protein 9, chloroplastic isoform X1 [Abrus precatorius]